MKRFLVLISLLNFITAGAMTYYSQGSLDPGLLSSWGNSLVGGTAPSNFTTPGDKFIIQNGHFMTTTSVWTIGGSGSILEIQNGGTLQGDHTIVLSGTFQIDGGGTYIHNNTGTVAQGPSLSIFSGAEAFLTNSNFEIRKWIDNITGLPNTTPGIIWGNLIVNLQMDLGTWNWNFADGQTVNITGNLDIRSTYLTTAAELRITPTGTHIVNVGGNFLLSGLKTEVAIKKRSTPSTIDNYTTMQVNGNISLTGSAKLDLGINTTSTTSAGLYELRFKGNFTAAAGTTVTTTANNNYEPYLVANGSSLQTITCVPTLNCSFRVASGATVNLAAALTAGTNRVIAVMGTLNQNVFTMNVNGRVEAPGGTFNSNASLTIGINCYACTGDGTYNTTSSTWCTLSGTKGTVNFTGNTITLNNNISTTNISAGHYLINSPGDIYFVNATANDMGTGASFPSAYAVRAGSILSFDATSYILGGRASYFGMGGTLRIGSVDGITATSNTTNGNIRVSSTKSYNNSGTNNFEYFGSSPQVTGDGLLATIPGQLKINNTAGMGTPGVSLSQNTTVSGTLDLTQGKLSTSISELLTVADNAVAVNYSNNSFVYGPMIKAGDETFEFPVGEGTELHTLTLVQVSGDAVTDRFQVKYNKDNPQAMFPGTLGGGIDHISSLEYWMVNKISGGAVIKKIRLQATTYSDATNLTALVITHNPTSAWQNDGNFANSGALAVGTVTSNDLSIFGPFTFASTNPYPVNPLPLNLISFDAVKITNTKAGVNWELAAYCSPSSSFEIQRANENKNFISIGHLAGSASSRYYNYMDNGLTSGLNYYRLKMTDENGKISYSRVAAILNSNEGLFLSMAGSAVVSHTGTITITAAKPERLNLLLIDMQGRLLRKQAYSVLAGNSRIELSFEGLAPGIYQVTGISSTGKTNLLRFIKQ